MQNENLSTLCVCANGSLHTDLTLARANKSHILHNLYCRGIAHACLISVVAIEEFFILYTPYSAVIANFLLTVFCYRKRFALFLKKPLYRFADFLAQNHFVACLSTQG